MMKTNHIAILVRDIDAISRVLPQACTLHASEEQPTEGTRERYITVGDDDDAPSLLLVQAVADGPYATALHKRGPGLHHIGCVCSDIDREVADGQIGRMLLHPTSLHMRQFGVVWLCRPGVPYLVELMENPEDSAKTYGKAAILLPVGIAIPPFASALSSNLTVEAGCSPAIRVILGGIEISFDPRMG